MTLILFSPTTQPRHLSTRPPSPVVRALFVCLMGYGLSIGTARAQNASPELTSFNVQRARISQVGMAVLGSWALGNLAVGAARVGHTSGEAQSFHRMNMYWNAVNLAVAGLGYYGAVSDATDTLSAFASLQAQAATEKILLFNVGLDVAYVMGGLYLRERGKNQLVEKTRDQLQGFGRSVILQGGFLFLFDVTLYWLHHRHLTHAKSLFEHLSLTGNGAAVVIRF